MRWIPTQHPVMFVAAALLSACNPAVVFSQTYDQGPVCTLTEENDFMFLTDGHYTQGFKVAYLQEDGSLPRWVARLSARIPALGFTLRTEKFGYELGQSIYTPEDVSTKQLLPNDRPYAGWLYTGLILQRRGLVAGDHPMLESFQLDFGIIGPGSGAEKSQALFHEINGSATPTGWSHQLKNEPALALKYQRSWRSSPAQQNERYFDFIPHAGASLGNIETSFRLGAAIRLGWNLPDDFGVQTIDSLITSEGGWSPSRASGHWGFYVFTGVEGRAVLYTAVLDGNLFRDSHHVAKEPLVGDWKSGFVIALRRLEVGYTFVFRTPEFVKQTREDRFGSLFLKFKF